MRPEDTPPAAGDRYARESFTMRRMRPKAPWVIAAVAAAAVIVGLIAV